VVRYHCTLPVPGVGSSRTGCLKQKTVTATKSKSSWRVSVAVFWLLFFLLVFESTLGNLRVVRSQKDLSVHAGPFSKKFEVVIFKESISKVFGSRLKALPWRKMRQRNFSGRDRTGRFVDGFPGGFVFRRSRQQQKEYEYGTMAICFVSKQRHRKEWR
jgi:hypothetical protein